jgi:hypothetical protein
MKQMKTWTLALALFALPALAQDKKEEAQAKVDAAMAEGCNTAKKLILAKKDVCAEEAAKMEPVDCATKESRKSVDFLALNSACANKQKAGASAAGAAPTKGEEKAPTSAKKKGSHCKVLDEAGAVVAEHDSEGGSIKCMGEVREKVKAAKCEPSKKLVYSFIGEFSGKEMKPTKMNITCPRK